MTTSLLTNPAAWANAFAISMITDVGLMRSILPTDGTNYAAPEERVWGKFEVPEHSKDYVRTLSTLWTGKPDQSLPPQKRYLPKLPSDQQPIVKTLQSTGAFEVSADRLISEGAIQPIVSEHQYNAAQAYCERLFSVWKDNDDSLDKKTALDRGYLLAMNGVMISLFSSAPIIGAFVETASRFAEFSRMQCMKNGKYREAAGDMARMLWLQGQTSGMQYNELFFQYAQAQTDRMILLLESKREPSENLDVIASFRNSAGNVYLGKLA